MPVKAPVEVALYQPQIPQNTGNIGRLCVGFSAKLTLIGPMGFTITDSKVKRAGLDYWPHLDLKIYPEFNAFYQDYQNRRLIVISKFSSMIVHDFEFLKGDVIVMGSETKGFPMELTEQFELERVRIPMNENIRSYNLANATAMTLLTAHRQLSW